jgi:hypothetical protein
MREKLEEVEPEGFDDVAVQCRDYISAWPTEQQGKAEALIANVRAARDDAGEVPAEAEIVEGYDEQTFDEDLEALEEDLAQAMGADTREARLEQVSAAVAAFSEAHPEPSDDQREAILEVYEPVRAELTQEGEAGEEESAANDILEGNTALDTEADAGDGDADEEDG